MKTIVVILLLIVVAVKSDVNVSWESNKLETKLAQSFGERMAK